MHTWVSYLCFADEETELKGAKSKDLKVVLRLWRKAGSSAVLRMPIAVLEPTFESSETIYSTPEKTQTSQASWEGRGAWVCRGNLEEFRSRCPLLTCPAPHSRAAGKTAEQFLH